MALNLLGAHVGGDIRLADSALAAVWSVDAVSVSTLAFVDILWSVLQLVILSAVGIAVGVVVYRWATGAGGDPDEDDGFSLSSLRRMHREGKITDEEFEKTKSLIIAGAKASLARSEGGVVDQNAGDQPGPPPSNHEDPASAADGGSESGDDDR